MIQSDDYYEILGVEKSASDSEIRRAFQKLAQKYHPDINKAPGAEEQFKKISEAYAVLSDPKKRSDYDLRRQNPFAATSSARAGYTPPQGGSTQNPFEDFFTTWQAQSQAQGKAGSAGYHGFNPQPGSDIVFPLDISLDLAKGGCTRGLHYQRFSTCPVCDGKGAPSALEIKTCSSCGGQGQVGFGIPGFFSGSTACAECGGSGKVVANACSRCSGAGRIQTQDEIVVGIPAGSHDGDELRFQGKGNAGSNGEASGDFVCRVCVPSEQLNGAQRQGAYLMGLSFTIFAVAALFLGAQVRVSSSVSTGVFFVIGLFIFLRSGEPHFNNLRWLKNFWTSFQLGMRAGIIMSIFLFGLGFCRLYY